MFLWNPDHNSGFYNANGTFLFRRPILTLFLFLSFHISRLMVLMFATSMFPLSHRTEKEEKINFLQLDIYQEQVHKIIIMGLRTKYLIKRKEKAGQRVDMIVTEEERSGGTVYWLFMIRTQKTLFCIRAEFFDVLLKLCNR